MILVTAVLVFLGETTAQDTDYGAGYQTMIMRNPSFSGTAGDGILRVSYMNFYPGNNYNLHSFYVSYDSYFPVLHGGAGFCLANDHMGGIVNDMRGYISYAYFLQADRDFYINAGLSAGFHHRGFSMGNAVFPDEIDRLGAITGFTSEPFENLNRTLFDISTGFLFLWKKWIAGVSVSHLTGPDLGRQGQPESRLERSFHIQVAGDIDLSPDHEMKLRPVGMMDLQDKYAYGGAGAVLESTNISASVVGLADNNGDLDIQPGFTIKTGKIMFFYNYRFNLKSGNDILPFSLMHQTGISLILNNVEKRLGSETIKIPRM